MFIVWPLHTREKREFEVEGSYGKFCPSPQECIYVFSILLIYAHETDIRTKVARCKVASKRRMPDLFRCVRSLDIHKNRKVEWTQRPIFRVRVLSKKSPSYLFIYNLATAALRLSFSTNILLSKRSLLNFATQFSDQTQFLWQNSKVQN